MNKDEIERRADTIMHQAFDRAFERFKQEKKRQLESDPVRQRNKLATPDEKAQRGIDYLTKSIKEFNEKHGKETSEDSARRYAVDIARQVDRKKSEK